MFVIKYRKIFYTIAVLLVGSSFFVMAFYGVNLSIDFTGGAITEVIYPESEIDLPSIREDLDKLDLGNYTIQKAGGDGVILRTKDLTEEERLGVMSSLALGDTVKIEEKRFEYYEILKENSLFVAFSFRKVSELGKESVSSWKYGMVAILALIHDISIPTGIFVILGHFYIDYQIDILFVTALLAILGFSVNDTIVVFDRVRENLKNSLKGETFEQIVGKSLSQTFARSINTSLTVLIALGSLFFFGGETTKQFALVLVFGVTFGTYSSIFLASPLLVTWQKFSNK